MRLSHANENIQNRYELVGAFWAPQLRQGRAGFGKPQQQVVKKWSIEPSLRPSTYVCALCVRAVDTIITMRKTALVRSLLTLSKSRKHVRLYSCSA